MMSTQNCCTLKALSSFSPQLQALVILKGPKEFVRFVNECILNLLLGNVPDITKEQLQPFKSVLHSLKQLSEQNIGAIKRDQARRIILSSRIGLKLVNFLKPYIEAKFCFNETKVCSTEI